MTDELSLTCSNCSQKYDTHERIPKSLTCLHTFCSDCLEKLDQSGVVTCPDCKKPTYVGKDGARSLPPNMAIVEKLKPGGDEKGSAEAPLRCQFCAIEDDIATWKCVQCNKVMCDDQKAVHKKLNKDWKDHHIFSLSPTDYKILCEEHHQEVQLVCAQCEQLVCMLCIVTDHHDHKCKALDKAFLDEKDSFQTVIAQAREKVDEFQKTFKTTKDGVSFEERKQNKTDMETAINTYFDDLETQVKTRRKELLAKLTELATTQEGTYTKSFDRVKGSAKFVEGAIAQVQAALKQGVQYAPLLLHLKRQLQKEIAAIGQLSDVNLFSQLSFAAPEELGTFIQRSGEVSHVLAEPKHTIAEGEGLYSSTPGQVSTFTITAFDHFEQRRTAGGDLFHVKFEHEWKDHVRYEKTDNQDGTYTVRYNLPRSVSKGSYTIHVTCCGKEIKGSPFSAEVEIASARHSFAEGDGLLSAEFGTPVTFKIVSCGPHGTRLTSGGETFTVTVKDDVALFAEPINATIKDNGDGTYDVSYQLPADVKATVEQITLDVKLRTKSIQGSPYVVATGPQVQFGPASTAVVLTNRNRTATNTINHHFVLGNQQYSKGRHTWRILLNKVEQNNWIFLGITHTIPNTSNSFSTATSWGIASMNQLYEGGKISYPSYSIPYSPYFREGDTVTFTLDCDANTLHIQEPRKVINHKLNLPPGKAWYPHFNLRGRNDSVTLV